MEWQKANLNIVDGMGWPAGHYLSHALIALLLDESCISKQESGIYSCTAGYRRGTMKQTRNQTVKNNKSERKYLKKFESSNLSQTKATKRSTKSVINVTTVLLSVILPLNVFDVKPHLKQVIISNYSAAFLNVHRALWMLFLPFAMTLLVQEH